MNWITLKRLRRYQGQQHLNEREACAAERGLALCSNCDCVVSAETRICPRCSAHIHLRKPDSITRSWVFLLTAVILYFPANLLPIMHTQSFFGSQSDTIISGIVLFWQTGSYGIAFIIFMASIFTPIFKIVVMFYLLLNLYPTRKPILATKLFFFVEFIGRWSMVDVFVVALTSALVRSQFAQVSPGSGIFAFAFVVFFTMLATESFDIRLLWDHFRQQRAQEIYGQTDH